MSMVDSYNAIRRASCLILMVLSVGCKGSSRGSEPADQAVQEEELTVVDAFHLQIKRDGSVICRTMNGQWEGTDRDVDLQFLPENILKFVHYGFGVRSSRGTYRCTKRGEITINIKLEGQKLEWPSMLLVKDGSCFALQREPFKKNGADIDKHIQWPLRSIPLSEESQFSK